MTEKIGGEAKNFSAELFLKLATANYICASLLSLPSTSLILWL